MAERLVIKGDDLLEAYNKIVYLHGEFDAATSRSDDAASSVGHSGLKSELENVAGSWRIHRGKILESLTDMESQIKGTLDTFGDVDDRMAQNLRGDGGHQAPADPGGGSTPPPTQPPTPRPQPQAGPGAAAPAPAQPGPVLDQAPEAVVRPVASGDRSQDSGDVTEPAVTASGQIDLSAFPPEMRVLLDKVQALTTSPDFIAKYPEFAAGASLGALLPLLLAAKAGHGGGGGDSGGTANGPQSARDEVRNLLQGVRKDVADGHLDGMTPGQARAELERLLGGTESGPDTAVDAPVAEGASPSEPVTSEPEAAAEPVTTTPEGTTAADPSAAPQSEGSSRASGSAASTGPAEVPDFREGSPMQNEDPSAVGQVPATPGAGEQPSAPSGTGSVVTDPTDGSGSGSSASADSFATPGATSTSASSSSPVDAGRAATTDAAAPNHIPTPMMSSGSMGGGSAAPSTGGGASSSTATATTTSPTPGSGSNSSSASPRTSTEKASETRKAEAAHGARTEGDAR